MRNSNRFLARFNFNQVLSLSVYGFIFSCLPLPYVYAQNAGQVEEVIVEVEQLEEQTLDDLVSVSAIDAEKLADAGIENVEDVAAYVPNLSLTQTETGTAICIRGICPGVNQGFDQSVGLYIDGVPLPRSQMARAPFLDLSSVQVLRGPQYVLDGNYSIAGSVHMLSNLSTDEFKAKADFNYIPDQQSKKLLLTFGGPLSETLAANLVLQRKDSEGYMLNLFTGERNMQADELLARFVLGFTPSDTLSFKLKVEQGQFDTVGRTMEIFYEEPTPAVNATALNPLTNRPFTRDGRHSQGTIAAPWVVESDYYFRPLRVSYDAALFSFSGLTASYAWAGKTYLEELESVYPRNFRKPEGLRDATLDYRRSTDSPENSQNDSTNITLNTEYWLDEIKFELVTSYIKYDYKEALDTDFTPVPILASTQAEIYDQSYFNLKFETPADAFIDWKGGLSYLNSDLEFSDALRFQLKERARSPIYPTELATFFGGPNGRTPDPAWAYFAQFQGGNLAVRGFSQYGTARQFEQSSEISAAFLKMGIQWHESFRTELGLRYTYAEKKAFRDLRFVNVDGSAIDFNSPTFDNGKFRDTVDQFAAFLGVQSHTNAYLPSQLSSFGDPKPRREGERREEQILPTFRFNWNVNDELSFFGTMSLANKLGGFDARAVTTDDVKVGIGLPLGTFEFEDEQAEAYELGTKWYLPEGRGEINIVAFYTKYKDLQISRFDGKSGFNVDNASEAHSQGVEIEGYAQFTDSFSMNYSLAYIDFQFDDFKLGSCYLGRRPDYYFVGNEVQSGLLYTLDGREVKKGDFLEIRYDVYREIDKFAQPNNPVGSTNRAFSSPDLDPASQWARINGADAWDKSDLTGSSGFCDFSGETNQYVAELQGTFSFNYEKEIVNVGLFRPTLDVIYNSGYHTSATHDPIAYQDAYFQFNGRLEISSFEDTWVVALTGENLSDEKILSYANDVPIGTRTQGSRTLMGVVRSPRAIGINLRYTFF